MSSIDKIDQEKYALLLRHLQMVIDFNKQTNLTRIDSIEEGKVLHIEDSLVALDEVDSSPAGLYGDLGSGAGYPGIPISVVTGRKTVLIDMRKKKMDLVQKMVNDLGIDNKVTTYTGRAELLAKAKPASFSVITARAVSKLSILMELASPLLSNKGRLICYKARIEEEELDHAKELQTKLALRLIGNRATTLSDGETKRRIIVFEKKGNPQIKLPRQEGFAQSKPL